MKEHRLCNLIPLVVQLRQSEVIIEPAREEREKVVGLWKKRDQFQRMLEINSCHATFYMI